VKLQGPLLPSQNFGMNRYYKLYRKKTGLYIFLFNVFSNIITRLYNSHSIKLPVKILIYVYWILDDSKTLSPEKYMTKCEDIIKI
jgi:hypothetical protein